MSLVTGETGGTHSQFTFNAETGTIILNNGRKFAVEITEANETRRLGADSGELLTLVQSILDQIGQQESITFQDLSHTSITAEGVKTDQKEVSEGVKTYKDETYTSEYSKISSIAHDTFSKLPKQPVSTVLSPERGERIGRDASGLIEAQKERQPPSTTRLSTATTLNLDEDDEDDNLLSMTVESRRVAGSTRRVSSQVLSFREEFDDTVDDLDEGSLTRSETRGLTEEKKGRVKKAWDNFLDWLSQSDWLSSHVEALGKRNPSRPIEIKKAQELLAQTESEADILDREGRVKFSNVLIPKKKPASEGSTQYDMSGLTIDNIECIVTETVQVNGKVKIREKSGHTEIRAGHRVAKAKARKKGIGTGENSREAMQLMLVAMKSHQEKLRVPYQQYTILTSLKDLSESPKDKNHWSGGSLDDLKAQAESLKGIFECTELNDFIAATEAFMEDRSSDDKHQEFQAKLGGLVAFLDEKANDTDTNLDLFISKIDQNVEALYSDYQKLESSFKLLTIHSTWGKAVIDNDPEGLGQLAKEITTELNQSRIALEDVRFKIHPDLKPKDTQWIEFAELKDSIFLPDNSELRAEFLHAYRWVMPSNEFIGMLNDRYQTNKVKIQTAEEPQLSKLKAEQKVIIEMIADWAAIRRIDPEEINSKISDDKTIKSVIEAIADDIKEEEEFAAFHKKIKDGLNPADIPAITPKDTEATYQERLVQISKGEMGKAERKAFVKEFRAQLTQKTVNSMLDIQQSEFANLGWSKAQKDKTSPNILCAIRDHFNETNNYFQLLIMTVADPSAEGGRRDASVEEQARMIAFLHDVQNDAIEEGDLNLAMGIEAAFGASSITRLKGAWSQKILSKEKVKRSFDKNKELLSPTGSYKQMREYLDQNPDALPFMGMLLQDLTFANDGQEMFRDSESDEGRLINTFKLRLLQSNISKALRFKGKFEKKQTDTDLQREISKTNDFARGDHDLFIISKRIQKSSQ